MIAAATSLDLSQAIARLRADPGAVAWMARRELARAAADSLANGESATDAVELLGCLADDAKWEVRLEVAQHLSLLPDEDFTRLANRLASDPTAFVRQAAERALDRRRRRARAAAVQQRLRGPDGVKWVEPQNFHFTLRFLGYTQPDALQRLVPALSAAVAAHEAFSLTLAGVGAFPNARRPQTIWVGVSEGARPLESLAGSVERAVVAQGFSPEERPFRAHLTLGRVKAPRPPVELARALEAMPEGEEVARIQVGEVVLMRSDLRPSGPIYTPMEVFGLS